MKQGRCQKCVRRKNEQSGPQRDLPPAPFADHPLNGTAPNPVSNRVFSKALGKVLHRPSFMKTPAIMLRLALGGVANIVTTGQRVLPRRPLELGYQYRFPTLEAALAALFGP